MIGWFLAGAYLGQRQHQRDKQLAKQRAERAARRRQTPMHPSAWWAYGLLLVASLASWPAFLVMLLVGCALWRYSAFRRQEHEEWRAEQLKIKAAEWDRIINGWRAPSASRRTSP